MNKNDVKIGNYYHLKFSDEWASDFDGNYKINGYSSPDVVVSLANGQSLFSLMFDPYGLDSEKYYSFIDDSTLIFIASKLVTTDPIEEEDNSTVYIPATILVYNECYEYVKADRISYNFISSPRIFDSDLAKNEFETESKNIIKKAVLGTNEFRIDNIAVSISDMEVLTTQSKYNKYLSKKDEENNKTLTALIQDKRNKEASERKLYMSTIEMDESKTLYTKRYNELTSKIDEANKIVQTNVEQKNILNNIKTYIIEVIADILVRTPTAFDGVPGYVSGNTAEQVYNLIYNSITTTSASN